MKHHEQILKVYNENRDKMIAFGIKKKWEKVGMTDLFIESLVDDLLIVTVNSKWGKVGFNGDDHIRKYMWNMLRRRIKIEYAIHYKNSIPPLTDQERIKNYELAKNIINNKRALGQIVKTTKERESKPYEFAQ
jgi:hypothetical protein